MRLMVAMGEDLLGGQLAQLILEAGHAVDRFKRLGDVDRMQLSGYDMLLVASRLTGGSGVDWIRDLRRKGVEIPILLIASREQFADMTQALLAGANEYLLVPVTPEELSARISSLWRRGSVSSLAPVQWGDTEVDVIHRYASRGGLRVDLTAREWNLVEALALQRHRIVPRRELEMLVHGQIPLASNALEVHLSSVRRKLGRDVIKTVRGVGYRFYDNRPSAALSLEPRSGAVAAP